MFPLQEVEPKQVIGKGKRPLSQEEEGGVYQGHWRGVLEKA